MPKMKRFIVMLVYKSHWDQSDEGYGAGQRCIVLGRYDDAADVNKLVYDLLLGGVIAKGQIRISDRREGDAGAMVP